jgi:hypothetical protein
LSSEAAAADYCKTLIIVAVAGGGLKKSSLSLARSPSIMKLGAAVSPELLG